MTTTKTKIIFLSVILLTVSISLVFGTNYAVAEIQEKNNDKPEPVEEDKFAEASTINFKEFSTQKMVNYSIMAMSNPEVTELLGTEFEYNGASYELSPEPNRITMTYSTPDGYDVNVSFEDGKISDVEKHEQVKFGYVNQYLGK